MGAQAATAAFCAGVMALSMPAQAGTAAQLTELPPLLMLTTATPTAGLAILAPFFMDAHIGAPTIPATLAVSAMLELAGGFTTRFAPIALLPMPAQAGTAARLA